MSKSTKDEHVLLFSGGPGISRYKSILLMIILVFGLTIIIDLPFEIAPSASASTIYVGGSGSGNFSEIQSAIDNASEGDTVYVYAGIYSESIEVTKTISLVGEDMDTTIIDGGGIGDVVDLNWADWVNVSGFTITNSSGFTGYAGLRLQGDHCRIYDNKIISNTIGISIYYSSNTSITNNHLESNDHWGIHHTDSSYNNISYNYISSSNLGGIRLRYSSNNIIADNQVTDNLEGISLSDSSNNTIIDNDVSLDNTIGISLEQSSYNDIVYNNITFNDKIGVGGTGIRFESSSSNNIIHHNYFIENGDQVRLDTATCLNNVWDDGNGEGNYWSDYNGLDDGSNGRIAQDGVGDTKIPHPFNDQGGGYYRLDNYPLILSDYEPPDKKDGEENGIGIFNLGKLGTFILGIIGIFIVAALYGFTETGKYKFMGLLIPMYTRIKKDQVLNQFLRGRINGYIEANPGEHYNAIKYALNINNGALTYHLRVLERENLVVSKRDGMYKRFYPKSANIPKTLGRLSDTQKRIVKTIREYDGITQTEIAKKLDISPQVVNYHVKILERGEIIRSEFGKKYRSKCFINHKILSEESLDMVSYPPKDMATDSF